MTAQVIPASTPVIAQAVAADAIEDVMPIGPKGVAASYKTPARDAAGGYLTPNRNLVAEELVWHLRVALNVAALGCRDADETATVAAYNAMLARAKNHLTAAQAGMGRVYKSRYGAAAQARNDDAMTKLYNFFAQPTGHDGFCATAKLVLTEVAAVEPTTLSGFAATALPRLEAPFLAFFADYDLYRAKLAAWQARHPAPSMLANMASAPAAPVTMIAASSNVSTVETGATQTAAVAGPTLQPAVAVVGK